MFALGEKAFYPAHGVGVIEKIESKVVSGREERFYVIRILDTDMTVVVPSSKADEVGLRHIVSEDKVEEVFKVFVNKQVDGKHVKTLPWNRRQRDYHAKLKSGSILDLAEIYKELIYIQNHKQLSFGEKKFMETVKRLLVKELACCKNCSEDVIIGKINSLLSS